MARVMHWVQDRSIAFYPTHIDFQLHLAPWAEWTIGHFLLLSGGDRLANLVQWWSFVGIALTASLIAAQLGLDQRGQALAAVIAASLPIGILEASSTQNDLVAAFWLMALAHFTLSALRDGIGWGNALGYAASLGLGILTKGTMYLFCTPFVLALIVIGFRRQGWRFLRTGLAISAVFVVLNLPHMLRTQRVFASPLGPSGIHTVQQPGPDTLISSMARYIGMNLYMPTEDFVLTRWGNEAMEGLHDALGMVINDERNTWQGHRFFVPYYYDARYGFAPNGFHEDRAGSPWHTLMILAALPLILALPRLRRNQELLLLSACAAGAFLLMSLMLRWQLFATRYEVPVFMLFAPALAAVLTADRPRWLAWLSLLVFLLGALPFLLINYSRPALPESIYRLSHERSIYDPRWDQIFANRPEFQPGYETAVQTLVESGCRQVGFVGVSSWEYPLWQRLINHYGWRSGDFRIEHVLVTNESASLQSQPPFAGFVPCAIVFVDVWPTHETFAALPPGFDLAYEQGEAISVYLRR